MQVAGQREEARTDVAGGSGAAAPASRGRRRASEVDMLDGPLRSGVFRFAMPVALTGILEQLSNMIDTVLVGRLTPGDAGTVAQAAVGANAPITGFVVALFVGISLGANVTIANAIGRGDEGAASRAAHTAVVMSLAGVAVLALGELVARPLLVALSVPPETIGEAVTFLRVYLLGMPAILLYNFEAAVLRSIGRARLPLHALCVSAAANVAFGLVFIGGLGWGVAGSALATDLGYLASAALLFWRLLTIDAPVRIDVRRLRLDGPSVRSIVAVGLPAGIQSAVFSVANIVIQSAIDRLGTTVMAASSASLSLEYVAYNLLNSYSQACTTFVGQNAGARRYGRCRETLRVSLVEGLLTCAALAALMLGAGRFLISLFNDDPEVVELGYLRVVYIFLSYFFSTVYEDLSGYLRGFGDSLAPAIVTTVVICGLRFWWVLSVFPASPTFETVMTVYPISLGANAACILALLLVRRPARRAELRDAAGSAGGAGASGGPRT